MDNNIYYELPSKEVDDTVIVHVQKPINKISSIKKATVQNCILSAGFLVLGFVISLIIIPENSWILSMVRNHCEAFKFTQFRDFVGMFPDVCLVDMVTLLIIGLSSLTFFTSAVNSVVIASSALCFGIGVGAMKYCSEIPDTARIAYIIHILIVMFLFCMTSSYSVRFNRVFKGRKYSHINMKEAFTHVESRQLCFALSCSELICVAVKLLYCLVMYLFH